MLKIILAIALVFVGMSIPAYAQTTAEFGYKLHPEKLLENTIGDLEVYVVSNDIMLPKSINNIKTSGAKYLLVPTYPTVKENIDIHTGMFRPLNLLLSPFFFPEPEYKIEMETINKENRKEMSLWEIKNLPKN